MTTDELTEDLGAQGEPVAWAWEFLSESTGEWVSVVDDAPPRGSYEYRNVRPLYEAPAAPRPETQGESAVCGAPAGWQLVPKEATEAMWGGLARQLVLWRDLSSPTGEALYRHLQRSGKDIPLWLRHEIPDMPGVPPKGSVAVAIYRAMLEAAPAHPAPAAPRTGSGVSVEEIAKLCDRLDRLNTISEPQACADVMDEARLMILALIAQAPRDGGATQGGWEEGTHR